MRAIRVQMATALLVFVLVQTAAVAITVEVNGQTLPGYAPAVQVGGRVLLPMRLVFEALGAAVKWEAATQTAIGVRGETVVRMSINRTTAYINDRPVLLDVPPQLIRGNTYMPVRFPAEAFGADVGWNEATQTVAISLVVEPPPPAGPQPGTATGVIAAVRENQVVLAVEATLRTYAVTSNTLIMQDGREVTARELRRGSLAKVEHDGQGNASLIRASLESVTGVVVAKVPNQILLDMRALPYAVQPEVEVALSNGEATRYSDIQNGDRVTLQVTPGTDEVYAIVVQRAAPPPPVPAEAVEITQFYHSADQPLKAGDALRVTMEGTPRGTAWFDIGDTRVGVPMVESRRPGRYDAEYRVEQDLNALGVPLIGHLEVQGRAAPPAQSQQPVTIDTVPPQIATFGPGQSERTINPQPNIGVLITDQNGSGVDDDRSTVTLERNGQVQAAEITRRGSLLSIVPTRLTPGEVQVLVEAVDKAGNRAERSWTFMVVAPEPGVETLAISHDAMGMTLMPGDTLTIAVVGPPNGVGSFDIGTWQRSLPLHSLVNKPGTYEGTFTVPALLQDREEILGASLRLPDGRRIAGKGATPVRFVPTRQLRPRLVSPAPGAQEGDDVVVEGDTQPLSQVNVRITWRGRILSILEQTGQVVDTQVTANARGHFKTDPISLRVQSLLPVKDVRYVLTCSTRNPRGQESEATTVEFTR